GSWLTDGTVKDAAAGTGLGLLPFLAAGITHQSDPTDKSAKKEYIRAVQDGLKYLLSQQKENGGFPGSMYTHGIATIALCEAYGLTLDPDLKKPAQLALDFILAAQHSAGGWRYQPKTPGDTSVTGWQVQA